MSNSVGFEDPPEDGKENAHGQGGVVELSTLITNPSMKRSESVEALNLSLHQCARDGDVDNMRRFLQSLTGNVKKKINAHDDEDLSALHYAARYNHVQIVKLLVESGAKVADVDDEGATPLHYAARYKRQRLQHTPNTEASTPDEDAENEEEDGNAPVIDNLDSTPDNSVVLYLVSKGADVNAKDIYGCPPLHFAAMRGNEVASKELLGCTNVNVEAVDLQQMTALHLAASHNEMEIVRMLIEAGANLRCVDEDMGTPLHFACMEGSEEVVKMLFEAGEKQDGWVTVSQMVTDQDNQQNSPLHLAVENRNYEVTKMCLEKGADVNMPRNNYSTPLHLAAVAGDIRIVELLLDHNARIDALDGTQATPLHKAAAFNHADVVEYLLERGARIERHDKDNFTPLLIAACQGHAASIKTLLKRGARLSSTDKNDKTAIYWAAEEDNVEALQVLISHPKARNLLDYSERYDNTALHIAAQKGYINCMKMLLDAGADMDAKNEEEQTPLHLAAKHGKTGAVRELVRRDKNVINDEDEDTNTALHLAALAGHNKVVTALLEAGADIEARNCSLWTPLDCAAAKGWEKTCRVLLEYDSPVDPMDKTKTTPMHLASRNGHPAVVELLLKWQANVAQRDTDGHNCLDLAIDNGHKNVAMVIVNSKRWREAMSNETIDLNTGLRVTPMRKLIKKLPDVAEKVFYNCTKTENGPDDPNYKITFDYEFLDDMYANWRDQESIDATSSAGSIYDEEYKLVPNAKAYSSDSTVLKKNHPLMIMVHTNQEDLLAHPLVTSLLRHKWNSFGRYFYYLNLAIYIVFLTFLTGYICTTAAPYMYRNANGTTHSVCDATVVKTKSISQSLFAEIGKYVIMVLAAFNIIRELFQMYNAKLNYFGWENLLEWVTYITALLLVIDFKKCQEQTGVREVWQWQLGSVSIFLAWIDLVLFIQKLPRFGIYVVMFTDITFTFIQFFPVFFLFIIAFAMSFFMLFQNQYEFRSPGNSLIKTSVMMIGEIEFGDVFLGLEDSTPNDPSNHGKMVYYEGIAYAIFATFLILMTIIIMNLLVGLAVDDIKAVQDQAVLKRLAMQVELALDVEAILPQFIRRRFVVRCQTLFPNVKSRNPIKRLLNMERSLWSGQSITKALDPELDDMEVLQENQEKMMDHINNLRFRFKGLKAQNEKIESMLTAIMKHNNIDWQEEDEQEEQDVVLTLFS